MSSNTVLFIDDNPKDLPKPVYRKHLKARYGVEVLLADPDDPIESGIRLLQQHSNMLAVLTDKCKQNDYRHITRFRALRTDVLIAVRSGNLTEKEKSRAYAAGADACFRKGESLDSFLQKAVDAYQAADRRFWSELPTLLHDSTKVGRWVAYTRHGLLVEGDDDLSLIQHCEREGLAGKFVVAQVVPDFPSEITESWFPSAE